MGSDRSYLNDSDFLIRQIESIQTPNLFQISKVGICYSVLILYLILLSYNSHPISFNLVLELLRILRAHGMIAITKNGNNSARF
jgi:hypothetical protein